MALTDDLLIILSSHSGLYRVLHAQLNGYDLNFKSSATSRKISDNITHVTLSRLKQKGLVENKGRIWKITRAGKEYLSRKILPSHSLPKAGYKPKNMIIAFDIPETDKHKRNWLRFELVRLGFSLLQRSVWFGPAPLPQEFLDSIRRLDLLPHLKFFEAKEADII